MENGDPNNSATSTTQSIVEDMIPYTPLNICHKQETDQKRCFIYGYQVAIKLVDISPTRMIDMYPYARISFNKMKSKMLILPGDRVGIRFGSKQNPYERLTVQPDIQAVVESNDPKLSQFKTRYTSQDDE